MYDWQELARNALEALGGHVQRQGCPTWLRIFEDPEEDSGLRLEADDDSLGFFGWVAPEACLAVGVVATGRATVSGEQSTSVTGESGTCESDALSTRVNDAGGVLPLRIACVVSRSGGLGWWMELPDGTRRSDPPRAGRLLDVLFRCLGLPTSPPEVPASEIHSAAWLASVIEGGLASDRRLTWSDVERLHPLARVLSGDLELHIGKSDDGDGVAQEELEDLLRIAAAACSWEEIHLQAVEGELDAFIDADVAAWMDEGMLSRWLLSMIPPIDQLLEAARPLLVPSAARRLAHAVRRHTPAQPARSSTGG
ncbi:MAG TPA: hypothetical protein VFZ97_11290 [Acidimicrobiales bacterium]